MARSAKDITGERFGKLVVTGFAGYGQEGRQQVALWNCRCDCGNTCTVRGYLLKSGRRKSCGCIRSLPEQMIGERFGRLTVTGPDTRNQSSLQKVICRCDCGTVKSIPTRYLKNGRVTDCGCGRREASRQKDQTDLERDARLETVREAFCGGNLRAAETLEEWAYIWVRCLLPPVVKASTVCMYAETMERHILPCLGKKKLGELTEAAVSQWVNILQKTDFPDTQNGRMTEGTVRNTLSVLSGCLRDAQKCGLMEENPCTVSAWTVRTKNVWDETDRLTDEKLAVLGPRLFSYRGEDGYPLGLAFQLLLYTGIALSEAAALRWEEVDFPEGELHLNYFVAQRRGQSAPGGQNYSLEPLTGRKKRTVPAPDFLMERLRKTREEFQGAPEEFVLCKSSKRPVQMDRMRSALTRRAHACGLGNVTPRMLRDNYAIRAVQSGASSDTVAELMGFASPQQVIRRYMPRAVTDKKELVRRMFQNRPEGENLEAEENTEKET